MTHLIMTTFIAIARVTSCALAILAAFCLETAHSEPKYKGVNGGALARYILICSDIDGVDADNVRSFYRQYFNGWRVPFVGDGRDIARLDHVSGAIFIATNGEFGDRYETCIKQLSEHGFDLNDRIVQQLSRVGTREMMDGGRLPDFAEPIRTIIRYYQENEWDILVYTARPKEPYSAQKAITGLFGLDVAVCSHSDACSFETNNGGNLND